MLCVKGTDRYNIQKLQISYYIEKTINSLSKFHLVEYGDVGYNQWKFGLWNNYIYNPGAYLIFD